MHAIPDYGNPEDPATRAKYAYLEAVVSIVGNIFLGSVKIVVGMLIMSVSITADGVHTFSDVGTSFVVILGTKASKKAPDSEHPFGHGRYEYIASLIIALALIAVGFELLITSLNRALLGGAPLLENSLIIYSFLAISIAIKEGMARYSMALGRKIDSKMLVTDAWHHRSDALTTIGVLTGIFLVQMGFPLADALMGILISIYIIYIAVKMTIETSGILVGKNAPPEEIARIKKRALSVKGVLGVHRIFVHDYGTTRVATLHIEVDSKASTDYAHKIASKVEKSVKKLINGDVTVHTEPGNSLRSSAVKDALGGIFSKFPEIKGYHNIRTYRDEKGGYVSAHVIVRKDMSVEESHALIHKIDRKFREKHPDYRVDLHIEPEK